MRALKQKFDFWFHKCRLLILFPCYFFLVLNILYCEFARPIDGNKNQTLISSRLSEFLIGALFLCLYFSIDEMNSLKCIMLLLAFVQFAKTSPVTFWEYVDKPGKFNCKIRRGSEVVMLIVNTYCLFFASMLSKLSLQFLSMLNQQRYKLIMLV